MALEAALNKYIFFTKQIKPLQDELDKFQYELSNRAKRLDEAGIMNDEHAQILAKDYNNIIELQSNISAIQAERSPFEKEVIDFMTAIAPLDIYPFRDEHDGGTTFYRIGSQFTGYRVTIDPAEYRRKKSSTLTPQ